MTTLEQLAVDVFSEDVEYGRSGDVGPNIVWAGERVDGGIRVDWECVLSDFEMAQLNDIAWEM